MDQASERWTVKEWMCDGEEMVIIIIQLYEYATAINAQPNRRK